MMRQAVFCLWLLLVLAPILGGECLAAGEPPPIELRLDARDRARVFSNGLQPVLGLADYFEFFDRNLLGRRDRIAEGPWNGTLRQNRPGRYLLTGSDISSGVGFELVFEQVDSATIQLTFRFTPPSRASNLGFDIAKLASDLFLGAGLEADPVQRSDAGEVPASPRSLEKRMLLTGKNRVRLRGAFMDLEISDLNRSHSIYLADGRSLPWDQRKSLIVGVARDGMTPGKEVSFRYALRSFPPTLGQGMMNTASASAAAPGPRPGEQPGTPAGLVAATGKGVPPGQPWPYLNIPPKQEVKQPGYYRLISGIVINGRVEGMAERQLAKELRQLTGLDIPIVAQQDQASSGIIFESAPAADLPAEGFALNVSPGQVVIRWADERGRLYAAFALSGRLRQTQDEWTWSCGELRDWPDLPLRGLCMELLKPPFRDLGLMKRYIEAMARARANTLILLHMPQNIRAWREGRDDGNWTPAQMTEIVSHARALGMEVWGGMGSGFRSKDFPEMDIRPGTNFYNPLSERSYLTLFDLYDQILKAYKPTTLLICHDEIQGLNLYAAGSGRDPGELLAADIGRIHAWLKGRGVKTAIWGDMLLDHGTWENQVGSAHGSHPRFNSGATQDALPALPKDLKILDWHYGRKSDYPSLGYFNRQGFAVIGAAWHDPLAAQALAASAKRYGGQGIIATDWGIWPTLSPAATTLQAPLCGWSAACSNPENGGDVAALAAMLQSPNRGGRLDKQFPVSLSKLANARRAASPEDSGTFGLGPALDLQGLTVGEQTLGGVRFGVTTDAVVAQSSTEARPSKEVSVFEGRIRAASLAFLQAAFVEAPQVQIRPLGRYHIIYESGRTETIELLENWNLTDVRSTIGLRRNVWSFVRNPELLAGAILGWRGTSTTGIPLNLQTLVWDNPAPEDIIRSIRLSPVGAPPRTRLAVVGLTFFQD